MAKVFLTVFSGNIGREAGGAVRSISGLFYISPEANEGFMVQNHMVALKKLSARSSPPFPFLLCRLMTQGASLYKVQAHLSRVNPSGCLGMQMKGKRINTDGSEMPSLWNYVGKEVVPMAEAEVPRFVNDLLKKGAAAGYKDIKASGE